MSNLALGDNADEIRSYQNMMLLKKIEMPEILETSTQDTRSRNRLDSVSPQRHPLRISRPTMAALVLLDDAALESAASDLGRLFIESIT